MSHAVVEEVISATVLQALTLHQPWAWAVADEVARKDVENRVWRAPEKAVGRVFAVHAGAVYDDAAAEGIRRELGLHVPGRHTCARGAVVAVARLARVVRDSPSRWAVRGQWHWCLAEVVRLEQPVPCKGAQGLWVLPAKVLEEVRAQVLARESVRAAMVALRPAEGPPSGFQKALADAAAATRPSVRTWSKGSARGAGPGASTGTVQVLVSKVQPCLWCRAMFHGRTGEPHATRITSQGGSAWPECEHGRMWLEDCRGVPVAPTCCRTSGEAVVRKLSAWAWSRCPLNPKRRGARS